MYKHGDRIVVVDNKPFCGWRVGQYGTVDEYVVGVEYPVRVIMDDGIRLPWRDVEVKLADDAPAE